MRANVLAGYTLLLVLNALIFFLCIVYYYVGIVTFEIAITKQEVFFFSFF